jgi:hypothetical protein
LGKNWAGKERILYRATRNEPGQKRADTLHAVGRQNRAGKKQKVYRRARDINGPEKCEKFTWMAGRKTALL